MWRSGGTAIGLAILLVSSGAPLLPSGTGLARSAQAAAHWTQITKSHNGTRSNLGLARTRDGTLHVLWAGPRNNPYTAIFDTPISPAGKVGRTQTVLSGWVAVHAPAAASAPDGSIHLIVSGQKASSNNDPYAGLNEVTGPGSWKVGAHAFGSSSITVASNADVRTAFLRTGQLVTAWTTAASLLFQKGVDPATLPQNITPKGLGQNVEVAVDQASGDAVIAFHGVKEGSNFFQRVLPSLDAPQPMLQAKSDAVSLAARAGGGVYAAYAPDPTKVWLTRFGGQPKSVPVPKGVQVSTASVAAAPSGRLWVLYGNVKRTYVTRTNPSMSCWEPVYSVPSPPNAVQYFRLEGEGSAGPLDLFADVTVDGKSKDGSYHRQVHPRLSLTVAKTVLKNARGQVTGVRVTVRVLDACDGVGGAKVTGLPGGHKTTGTSGSIIFTVPPSTKGSFALTATKAGYIGAKGRLSL